MYSEMNRGLLDEATGRRMKPTNFFLGAVVTNHKRYERELVPQYLKLRKKIETGARFIINQAGYDARKDDELLRWLALSGLDVPSSRTSSSSRSARPAPSTRAGFPASWSLMSWSPSPSVRRARQTGDVRSSSSWRQNRWRSRGGSASAAPTWAASWISQTAKRSSPARTGSDRMAGRHSRVRSTSPIADEFYYFERDESTGLCASEINRALVVSRTNAARRRARLHTPINYRASRLAHWAVFDPEAPLFDVARRFYSAVESAPVSARKVLHLAEHASKVPLYNCKDCGDCSLPEIAYLCPESQCAKNQRNGPCGGSHDGLCEVTDKECIWARAYERLKPYGEEASMLDGPVVFNDNALRGTSAWANTFLGRDHQARSAAGQEDVK